MHFEYLPPLSQLTAGNYPQHPAKFSSALSTKLVNKQKPIIQQQGNSERNFGSNELYTLL